MDKQVAVIYDAEGWAQHKTALGLAKYAPPGYKVTPWLHRNWPSKDASIVQKYDAAIFLAWYEQRPANDLGVRSITVITNFGCFYEQPEIPTSYDSPDWRPIGASNQRNLSTLHQYLRTLCHSKHSSHRAICTSVQIYERTCDTLDRLDKGPAERFLKYLPLGVDTDTFSPSYYVKERKRRPTVGWIGQCNPGVPNIKGFDWCLVPIMQQLPDFEFKLNTRDHTNALDSKEMCHWYSSLDMLLCTSIEEGTPCTALEALACNIPAIVTDTGDVSEFIKSHSNLENEFGNCIPAYSHKHAVKVTIQEAIEVIKWRGNHLKPSSEFPYSPRRAILSHRSWEVLAKDWLEYAVGEGQ